MTDSFIQQAALKFVRAQPKESAADLVNLLRREAELEEIIERERLEFAAVMEMVAARGKGSWFRGPKMG